MQPQGSSAGTESAEAKRSREALERQLAAETAAKEEREKGLEVERQRALEEARRKAATAAAAARPSPIAVAAASAPPAAAPLAAEAQPTTPPPAEPARVVRTEPSAPDPIAVTPNVFLDPSQVDTLPSILKESAVTWPRSALYSRRQGLIILQATVNADGRVEEVKVLRADHDGFGISTAAADAVRRYQFEPGTKGGVKIKTFATVTIPYRFQAR
jgi:TonB family protein